MFSHKFPPLAALTSRSAALECISLSRGNVSVSASPATRVIRETQFAGLTPAARGKVRDIYDLGDKLLIVATDRLSAFDVILPTPIPDKGRILTQLSLFWFNLLKDVVPNHVLSSTDFPAPFDKFKDDLAGRSMIVRKTQPLPIECVVRGYLSGSGWKDYRATGKICGIALPPGLRESDRLPEPIFTPATKAATGHDENILFEQASSLIGKDLAEKVRTVSLEIYSRAAAYAEPRGVILADTKFEFGLLNDRLIWIDEALTPDSSRFWPAAQYNPGGPQPSFDKQFVRDYLERIQWPKTPPGPELPPEVVAATRAKYREAYRILAGRELD
jgi:phosphoribosylaminoimidazole-succinocarboxamide synthase